MKYTPHFSSRFKKDYKKAQRQGMDIPRLKAVVKMLCEGTVLPPEYRDHALRGNYEGCRECHIKNDWLLIYRLYEDIMVLEAVRTGSHSELFG